MGDYVDRGWRKLFIDELLTLSDFPTDYKFPETVEVPMDKPTAAGKTHRIKKVDYDVKWGMIGNIVLPK